MACENIDSAAEIVNLIGPEHLELHLSSPILDLAHSKIHNYGGLFSGTLAAEV